MLSLYGLCIIAAGTFLAKPPSKLTEKKKSVNRILKTKQSCSKYLQGIETESRREGFRSIQLVQEKRHIVNIY